MKTYIPVLVSAVLITTTASADSFYHGFAVGNSDLYPNNLEDAYNTLPIAVQPGTGDSYGGNALRHRQLDGIVTSRVTNDNFNQIVYGNIATGNSDLE